MVRTWLLGATILIGICAPLVAVVSGVPLWGWGFPASFSVAGIVIGWLGSVIDRAEPGHPVGRLFVIGGLAAVVLQLTIEIVLVIEAPWRPVVWSVLENSLYMVPLACWFTGLARFPEGRWAFRAAPLIVGIGCWGVFALMLPMSAFLPALTPGIEPNPWVGSGPISSTSAAVAMATVFQATPLALAVGHVAVYRRATALRRRQIGIVIAAIGLLGVAAILSQAFSGNVATSAFAAMEMLSLLSVFVAIAVGITRYRLYDIDRLVSRTIAYVIITAILGGVFVTGIVVLGTVLGGLAEGQTLAVSASTLVAIALFQPLRRRLQRIVDRHFHRAGYDAARIVEGFQARIRDDVDLGSLGNELLVATQGSVRPTAAAIWLVGGGHPGDRPP